MIVLMRYKKITRKELWVLYVFSLCFLFGCQQNTPEQNTVAVDDIREESFLDHHHQAYYLDRKLPTEHGKASWYGDRFKGKRTASGERFDPTDYTAAHPSLPFNTYLKVTNIKNNKSVIVRVNDRGPFKKGRIVDLSRKSAKHIGLHVAGVGQVRIDVVKPKSDDMIKHAHNILSEGDKK